MALGKTINTVVMVLTILLGCVMIYLPFFYDKTDAESMACVKSAYKQCDKLKPIMITLGTLVLLFGLTTLTVKLMA